MRKFFYLLLWVLVSASLSAQHVAPISVSLTRVDLDSLRVQYTSNPLGLCAELQRVQTLQQADDQAIAEAEKVLKDEKAYAKQLAAYIKSSEQFIANMERSAEAQSKEALSQKGVLDGQTKGLAKMPLLPTETRESYINLLQTERGHMDSLLDYLDKCNAYAVKASADLRAVNAGLAGFEVELQTKELALERLREEAKNRKNLVKQELKVAKASAKK